MTGYASRHRAMDATHNNEKLFTRLKSVQELAEALETDLEKLTYHAISKRSRSLYRTFEIPKKSGGTRIISAPIPFWKKIQRRLAEILLEIYEPKAVVHGFAQKRSVCTNARMHVGRRFILNVDLKDFFPSINFGRVRGMFLKTPYNCPPEVATLLAQICCCNNELPQGAPTSPIISNMLCSTLDSYLRKLASEYNCSYSRYADDITFSTNKNSFLPHLAKKKIVDGKDVYYPGEKLITVIEKNGFRINVDKFRLQFKHQRQEVTGLVTNHKLNVLRTYIREIRALLHNWNTKGIDECQLFYEAEVRKKRSPELNHKSIPLFKDYIKGKLDYLRMVRGKNDFIVAKFLGQLAALDSSLIDASTILQEKEEIEKLLDHCWIINVTDHKGFVSQGTGFFLQDYGLVTCSHVLGRKITGITATSRHGEHQWKAKIISRNDIKDIAVLKIDYTPESNLEISNVKVKRLTPVMVLGFPNFNDGDTGSAYTGKVSGFRTYFDTPFILIDTTIIGGNSGGPVLDIYGKVIGIAARGGASQSKAQNTEFNAVVPVSELEEFR